ncbi:MAG TPA: prepilin-type N-terminal cleavage/methylation domain-containing protein [Stellaceae bacterium]|jgi:general secretion pathway protein I
MTGHRRQRRRGGGEIADAGRGGEAGFTLIEIIVAFTVTALILGGLYQLFSTGVRAGTDAASYGEAVMIAESTLDTLGIVGPLVPGEVRDVVGGRFARLAVVRLRPDLAERAADNAAAAAPTLYQIDVEVTWTEARRTRSVSLTTLRVMPPAPPS